MADKKPRDSMLNKIRNLNTVTLSTNAQTYGSSQDPAGVVKTNVDRYIESVRRDASDMDRHVINSRVSRFKLGLNAKNRQDLYDIIKDEDMITSISSLIGSENAKFAQLLKDYELIKRCLPQIHKVITSLKNNILSPDAMADSALGIKFPAAADASERAKIEELLKKYDLNSKLQEWVMDYLIASIKYVTVAPYSEIPDLLEGDKPLNEAIAQLKEEVGNVETLLEATGGKIENDVLTEAISWTEKVPNEQGNALIDKDIKIEPQEITEAINEALSNIEIIRGGEKYFKKAVLNEAIHLSKMTDMEDISMKSVVKRLKKIDDETKSRVTGFDDIAAEGMVSANTLKKIRKNVDFRGCHLEELPAAKVIPFRMRDTIIGYFYVEDRYSTSPDRVHQNNLSTVMDKINSSVYMRNDSTSNAARVEMTIVRSIADRLIKVVDDRFLNDNYDDMDIIYEFIKDNALHRDKKRVVFFHPDDICEFKRKDGSIMKNCMFYAKLYILTLLSNVITNVTRGADRNIYYVKTGLTTDIEGQVHSTIRAIKQNQIRYSDMGTINEIFNLVGSTVDVFMPVSVDGERPIDTETISGQNVDMNNDFLQWLMKSIIQSFGVPASVIDDFENIEFAKTVAMSNIDMAKAVVDAQNELSGPLTKIFRLIITYEMPEFDHVDGVELVLNPPSVIVFDMMRDRVDAINNMADTLGSLLIAPQDETIQEKQLRLFKLEYFKTNMPNLDWSTIEKAAELAAQKAQGEKLKNDINTETDDFGDSGTY